MTDLAELVPRRRPTQQERSANTRQALLDATIECLIDLGYDNSTTAAISERAALSRGAHLHHFQTRACLFRSTVEVLARRVGREFADRVKALPQGAGRTAAALDMLWAVYCGPLFTTVLELAVHARTDPELRVQPAPLESTFRREAMPLLRHAFTGRTENHELDDLIALSLATVRGLAIMPLLGQSAEANDSAWKRSRAELLHLLETRSVEASSTPSTAGFGK
ncbi:MAG TPA: TetR/AcrR family transcriptional regulator [Acidimicrobiales bacterium]|nr:TetR/AcrR family transcriptional regulator [Acidimicrobiales bacterium]